MTGTTDSGRSLAERRNDFLRYVVDHADNPMETVWGAYRKFDGYALAALATGEDAVAKRLLGETLDLIAENLAEERAHPEKKWHLADFALHPLLRGYFQYREDRFPDDPIWDRLAETATGFLFHYGDLSENHNFLHLTLRYLIGQAWPDTTFADGRTGREHREDARAGIVTWLRNWSARGSAEWGADIYYNVNLLSLLNLFDFADDAKLREAAGGVLDLTALDEALDTFAGTAAGAARRSYSVYRMDLRQSPSRPLIYLWFDPPGVEEPFNLNFIGGVIQAACSDYLPPEPIRWIANDTTADKNRATHIPGVWAGVDADHLGKHTLRLPGVQQSTMISPGGGARYTEHVWQVTMGVEALIFANHPTLVTPVHADQNTKTPEEIAAIYDQPRPETAPDGGAWYWTYANVPPGHAGDVRPGYWQGNGVGPRTFGTGPLSFLLWDIPADNPLPFAHVYLPTWAFDEVIEDGPWLFARHGDGYCALWTTCGYARKSAGFWADCEFRLMGNQCGLLSFVGNRVQYAEFSTFQEQARDRAPLWDPESLTLSALPLHATSRLSVSYAAGPSRDNLIIETKGPRFDTPWGALALNTLVLDLDTPAGTYELDLRNALS